MHAAAEDADQTRRALKPVQRATLHIFGERQHILLQIPHYLINGQSLLSLANYVLQLFTNPPGLDPEFGDEPQRLAPPPSDAASFPTATAEYQARSRAEIGHWLGSFPSVGIGASNLYNAPGPTAVKRMTVERDATRTHTNPRR